MGFREAQHAVDQWVGQFGVGYFSPLAYVVRLAEEVGELAREVNHQFGPKPKKPEEAPGSIPMELADILFVVVCIANSQKIDLDDAFATMMAKVTSRDAARWSRKAR
ncbi:MAG: nucleotide pyrophosphohydrolase [Gemmatimonadales bacterium]